MKLAALDDAACAIHTLNTIILICKISLPLAMTLSMAIKRFCFNLNLEIIATFVKDI